ncbi:MAG: HD domain-containing protein [Spirochaetota bacterium]|nr:HD domain-containing protein [Spirochaetota bacterium]
MTSKNTMIIENAIKYVHEIFARDFSGHDFYHTMRVYKTAVQIAVRENADILTVQLAALLHDVDDIKLSPTTYSVKKNAVDFMKQNKLSDEIINSVCKIIEEVSFAGTDSVVPSSIEGKCVQDADRLDAIGAVGIARAFAYGGNKGRKMYDPDIKPMTNMNKEQYRQNDNSTTINHFYEKLLLLKDMMNTETAKEIAERRHAFMQTYLDEFLAEWNNEKL